MDVIFKCRLQPFSLPLFTRFFSLHPLHLLRVYRSLIFMYFLHTFFFIFCVLCPTSFKFSSDFVFFFIRCTFSFAWPFQFLFFFVSGKCIYVDAVCLQKLICVNVCMIQDRSHKIKNKFEMRN